MQPEENGPPRRLLGWILALAVALRLGVAFYMGDTVEALPGIFDQVSYHRLALRVLEGHGFSFDQPWWPLTRADQPTAHWSYLYTLFVAGAYAVFGPHPLAPRLLQAAAAGVLMPWLTVRLSRRVWPGAPAWAALVPGAWTAVYGYFVYYAAALLTETFYFVGILWTLDVALRLAAPAPDAARRPWRSWAELGLALGLTAHLRQVFLLFAPFLFLWLAGALLRRAGQTWRDLLRGMLLGGGLAGLLILPATLYNFSRFGRPVLLNTNAGFAFFWANHPIYGDRFQGVLPSEVASYQDLIPPELRRLDEAAMESALFGQGLGFVAADPARYLRLSFSRIPVYFQFWPSPESSQLSNIVRVASFGLALPFMLLGIGQWARRGGRPGALLLLFALVYSLVHLLSWSLIRYRLPVDAVLLVFAGQGLAALWPGRRAAGL